MNSKALYYSVMKKTTSRKPAAAPKVAGKPALTPIQRAMLQMVDNCAASVARELGRPVEEILQWPVARAMRRKALRVSI